MWIAALAMLAAFCGCRSGAKPKPRAARITFDQKQYSFGTVAQGTKVTHSFFFRNAGGAGLVVDGVRSACGCTAAVVAEDVVEPGQTAAVRVTLDTNGLAGSESRTVTVYSSDPSHPVTTLTLTGTIEAAVKVEPAELYAGRLGRGAAVRQPVDVVLLDDDVEVTAVRSPGSVLDLLVSDLDGDQRGKRLSFRIDPHAALGPFAEEVHVATSSAAAPDLLVPVVGVVEGDLTVSPPRVTLGTLREDEQPSQVLVLRNRGAQPVHLQLGSGTPTWVQVTIETVEAGHEYHLHVRPRPPLPSGRLEGDVEIDTDDADQPRLLLPITGAVHEKR